MDRFGRERHVVVPVGLERGPIRAGSWGGLAARQESGQNRAMRSHDVRGVGLTVLLAMITGCGDRAGSGALESGVQNGSGSQQDRDASRGMFDASVSTGPDAGAPAATDAGSRPGLIGTFPGGLVLTDAAIAAFNALTPEERSVGQARCDSGPVDSGIGLTCTPRGGECPAGLTCTARFGGDTGICTELGCGPPPNDCGPGASCCTLLQAGGASLCFPDACFPASCLQNFQ